jgi:hypothetical protein
VLGERELIGGEEGDRESARLAKELVEGRLASDRDPDERR